MACLLIDRFLLVSDALNECAYAEQKSRKHRILNSNAVVCEKYHDCFTKEGILEQPPADIRRRSMLWLT